MSREIENELLDLERQYWQAIQDRDVDAAMRLTDDPCIVAGAQGVARLDRETMNRMLQSAPYTLNRFELSNDAQVRMRLDVSQLPKPFQVNAITSREWNLASDWREVPVPTDLLR